MKQISMGMLLGGATFVALLAFNNCSKGFELAEGVDTLSSLSSTCVAKIRALSFAGVPEAQSEAPYDCRALSEYACIRRIYQPSEQDSDKVASECAETSEGHACLSLRTLTISTASARKIAGVKDSDFQDGGEYNYQEVNCYQDHARNKGVALFSATEKTLAESLNSVIAQCQRRNP